MNTETRPYTFDRVVRLLIGVVIAGAVLWLIDALKDVLLPFLSHINPSDIFTKMTT